MMLTFHSSVSRSPSVFSSQNYLQWDKYSSCWTKIGFLKISKSSATSACHVHGCFPTLLSYYKVVHFATLLHKCVSYFTFGEVVDFNSCAQLFLRRVFSSLFKMILVLTLPFIAECINFSEFNKVVEILQKLAPDASWLCHFLGKEYEVSELRFLLMRIIYVEVSYNLRGKITMFKYQAWCIIVI